MTYRHGVYISEQPTSVVPPVRVSAGLPVVIGTAPVNLGVESNVNVPILAYTYAEAVAALGYSDDWASYTLCEFMKSHFSLFNVAPVVLINVLDPDTHKTVVSGSSVTLGADDTVKLADLGILNSTLTVAVGGSPKTVTTDYTAAFDSDGYLVITRVSTGSIAAGATLTVGYSKLAPGSVETADIIGGIDGTTQAKTGLELIDDVFPRFRLVPGMLLSPYWSTYPEVAAVMHAKSSNINNHFKAIAIADIDSKIGTKDVKTLTCPAFADATGGDYAVVYDTAGAAWAIALDKTGSDAEPTGAIWAGIAADHKAQANISGATTDEDVAAIVRTAFAALTGFTAVITAAASGATVVFTQVAYGDVTDGVVSNADDSGDGSLSIANTTAGRDAGADVYTEAPTWKTTNNYDNSQLAVCWPKVKLGSSQYHLGTQLAGLICKTDSENEDIPYFSPSNKSLQMSSAVVAAGTEVWLGPDQAAYLNGLGIITPLNFIGGWKLWGNRMSSYPGITDPKDTFLPIRRMMNWIGNTIILTFWQKVDYPINKRLVETILDSVNIWLNGLASRGFILGGRCEFTQDENPATDLIDGIVRFHVYVTPPSPAREIDFILEYDPQYLSSLF